MVYDNKMKIHNLFNSLSTFLFFMSLFGLLIQDLSGCKDTAVGIAHRDIIPDDRFTATSYYGRSNDNTRYQPKNARQNGAARGWGPSTTNDPNDYLQIDLGQVFVICALATQGCNGCSEWTKQYKIATSVNNVNWTTFKNGSTEKLFPGNTDSNTVVKNVLAFPVLLRFIRFIPKTYHVWKVLRVEAYGFGKDYSSLPVGIGSRKIPDSDMTSSTTYNSTTSSSKARLNYIAGSSWCAATSDSSPYLQINLGSPYIICGIATQGDHMTDQWVQSYNMLSSNDGSTFSTYTENGQVKLFPGNFDSSTAVKNLLYDFTVGQYIRVAPTSHYGSTNCMRTEVYGVKQNGSCTNMFVGISYSSIIPDHRFTASSSYGGNYIPSNARLGAIMKAWTPKTKAGGDWLQIDLGYAIIVCALATQGAGDLNDEWAKTYKIKVSLDNANWDYYKENNIDKRFSGNANKDDIVKNRLANPIKAKFIRFYPLTFNNWPAMKVEVYGISSVCSSPVGLEVSEVVQTSQMTSSSHLDNTHTASHGRLYGNNSWCSSTSSNTEYIHINLTQVMTVTGIASQGDHTMNRWVWTYTISYSMDGNLWNTYKAGGNSHKTFQGNSDKETVIVQWLSHPVTARHIKVIPQTWNTGICMRIELYGCDYATRPFISGLTNQNLTPPASNSYADLVCIVQEPLIQYIKWYTGNTDITIQSTGLVSGANGVKQSTMRVNYTSDADVLNTYDCFRSKSSLFCYKPFTCRAMYGNTKIAADGIKSIGVKVRYDYPSTHPKLTVGFRSSTVVGIVWQKIPLNNFQKKVTSYVLVYRNNTFSRTMMVSALSVVLIGLEIYTSYNIKIKAVSIVGDGKWSQPMNFRTDSIVPTGFPASIRAVALTSKSIRVTWQTPTSGINGPFLGYRVFCVSGGDRHEITTSPQQTSHTFIGLRKWTFYNVTVVIRNDKGDGPIHTYVMRQTIEDVPSVSPPNVTFSNINKTTFRVSWNKIPLSKSNGLVVAYEINQTLVQRGRARRSIDAVGQVKMMNSSCCSLYLYDLLVCAEYHITIKGYTSAGAGPSNMKSLKTSVPGPPVELDIQTTKKRGISLTWQKPDSVTEVVETYTILFKGMKHYNRSFVHSGSLSVLSTQKEMHNMYPGTSYTFRVSATTACGEGEYSVSVSSSTKVDAPPAPVVEFVLNITTQVNAITVWESFDINGQIEAYQFIVAGENSSIDETRLKIYEEANKEELNYYITAEIKADPGKKFPRVFILGDEREYNGYKNVKISYGKTFNVLQRAMTQNENKEYLAGPSTLIARGKIPENKESFSRKQTDTAYMGQGSLFFAVSLAFNAVFLIIIIIMVVYNRKLKKQLDEIKKKEKDRPVTDFPQDVYTNIANSSGETLSMADLPAQTGSTYQYDFRGTVDPSDVQTEVITCNTIATDAVGGIYESITEEIKPNPNVQIYDTIDQEKLGKNREQIENDTVSSSQPVYQSLVQESQTKPFYESLHT